MSIAVLLAAVMTSEPAVAAPPPAPESPIVVQGIHDRDKKISRFIKELTPAPVHGQIGRFDDWSGHMARIALAEPQGGRKQFSGTICGAGEGGIVHLTGKDGKDYPIPFSSISSAKLLLTDELIDATNPLSTEGADLIKTEG
jgi:hypothetical protein